MYWGEKRKQTKTQLHHWIKNQRFVNALWSKIWPIFWMHFVPTCCVICFLPSWMHKKVEVTGCMVWLQTLALQCAFFSELCHWKGHSTFHSSDGSSVQSLFHHWHPQVIFLPLSKTIYFYHQLVIQLYFKNGEMDSLGTSVSPVNIMVISWVLPFGYNTFIKKIKYQFQTLQETKY